MANFPEHLGQNARLSDKATQAFLDASCLRCIVWWGLLLCFNLLTYSLSQSTAFCQGGKENPSLLFVCFLRQGLSLGWPWGYWCAPPCSAVSFWSHDLWETHLLISCNVICFKSILGVSGGPGRHKTWLELPVWPTPLATWTEEHSMGALLLLLSSLSLYR